MRWWASEIRLWDGDRERKHPHIHDENIPSNGRLEKQEHTNSNPCILKRKQIEEMIKISTQMPGVKSCRGEKRVGCCQWQLPDLADF